MPIGYSIVCCARSRYRDMDTRTRSAPRPTTDELLRLQYDARRLTETLRRQPRSAGGERRSRRHGRGMDFQESRAYQPGDDIRHLDWRVTARTGVAHTKLFSEERQRPVLLVIDANPSLFFGTRKTFKSVVAAQLAALLGWLAIHQGDRLGAIFYAGTTQQWLPLKAGRPAIMRLIRALTEWFAPDPLPAPQASADGLPEVLQRLGRGPQGSGLIALISDFQRLDPTALDTPLARLRIRHDLQAYRIADALELSLPPPGCYPVSDGQRQHVIDLRQHRQRRDWETRQQQHHRRLAQLMRRHAIPWQTLDTRDDVVAVLQRARPMTLAAAP